MVRRKTPPTHIGPDGPYLSPCYANGCEGHFIPRRGIYGDFFGCSQFPRCRATRSYESMMGEITASVYGEHEFDADDYLRWDW